MSKLSLQPPRVAMVDPQTGMITVPWYRWFTDSYIRQGGAEAPTITETTQTIINLTEVVEDQMLAPAAVFLAADDDVSPPYAAMPASDDLTPPQALIEAVEFLQAEVRALAEQLAAAHNEIQELKQGTML